ncbi:uncharacterized protein IL334_007067 [Kwoniella shivajii]|uniref:ARM repeat-containing protein n=1 Tax=Kwoniella shivajii TaxID=564305 RepID=A0ABZ1D7N5_9TREE|nr:hypothetical protein IL334_007067 [Kwoniella shivajii]
MTTTQTTLAGDVAKALSNDPTQGAFKLVQDLKLSLDRDGSDLSSTITVLDKLAVTLRDVNAITKPSDEVLRQAARVVANLVIDCDENRQIIVDFEYLSVICGIPALAQSPTDAYAPAIIAIVASLHNLSVEKHGEWYAVERANELDSVVSYLRQDLYLRTIIHITKQWTEDFYSPSPHDETSTIVRWSWSILSILLEKPPPSINNTIFDALLTPFSSSSDDYDTHLHILTSACASIEACLTPETPLRQQVLPYLTLLTEFVEKADIPEDQEDTNEIEDQEGEEGEGEEEGEEADDGADYDKTLGSAKAAIVRTLVSLSSDIPPSSSFWQRIRIWLERKDRPDLLNCALLSFGNSIIDGKFSFGKILAYSSDSSAKSLLNGETSLLPNILPLLDPSTQATTQHSVIGLIKNLSIPTENKAVLGEAGVIERLAGMNIWSQERDLLGSVQGGAAGILKNLCRNNAENSHRFLLQPLDPLLDLIKRADDPPLRFECTRIFVNVIKSLASAKQPLSSSTISNSRVIESIVKMLVEGSRYPILQSEAVIALTLLATFGSSETKSQVNSTLSGPGLDIVRGMSQDGRKEIRENANTLLNVI